MRGSARPLVAHESGICVGEKDGAIHVCPLSAVPHVVAHSGASHLLTCLQDEIVVETPRPILPDRHLRLHIHDISQPMPGFAAHDLKRQ